MNIMIRNHFSEVQMPACPVLKLLKDQKALVTGGNRGVGRGIALALSRAGADVAVNFMDGKPEADETAGEIVRCGSNALTCRADVSREDEVRRMFKHVEDVFGGLDIVINCAHVAVNGPLEQLSTDQWRRALDVNLTGQFLCMREAVRVFRTQEARPQVSCAAGKIVCVNPVQEDSALAGHADYAACRGGAIQLMKSFALEVAPHRIRVNAVCPGVIRTPADAGGWETPESFHGLMRLVPRKRMGDMGDVGRAVVWLVSDQSDYVHGTTLHVDGGMALCNGAVQDSQT